MNAAWIKHTKRRYGSLRQHGGAPAIPGSASIFSVEGLAMRPELVCRDRVTAIEELEEVVEVEGTKEGGMNEGAT